MIFQEPMTSLNPCFTVGFQIDEALKTHLDLDKAARAARAPSSCSTSSAFPAPEQRLSSFPHQLSGGMNQRVMIAMAIACNPKLLIADEPTTALDVTIQAQILDLLVKLQKETGMALVLITHSMGVVAETAERVSVQYAGQKVEEQPVAGPLCRSAPSLHGGAARGAARARQRRGACPPFPASCRASSTGPTGCLFAPRCSFATELCRSTPPRRIDGTLCHYPLRQRRAARPSRQGEGGMSTVLTARGPRRATTASRAAPSRNLRPLKALDGASFTLERGKTLAVVGESGCGKSTLARLVTMIEPPTAGSLIIDGQEIVGATAEHAAGAAPQGADRLPESLWLAQSAPEDRPCMLEEPLLINTRHAGGRAQRTRARHDGQRRPAARALRPLPAHVLGRPAPAHRDRPRADAATRTCWCSTSRSRRSISRSRRRCSTSWPTCRRSSTSPISSSATTCRWCATSPTR